MLQIERLEKIHDYLCIHKHAGINELASELDMSTSTVRRGLKELEEKNVVQILRGSAILLGSGNTYEHPYSIKRRRHGEEKKRIAAYAASCLAANNSIYLDASSTVRELCPHLKTMQDITICTNDILIAGDLSAAQGLIVMVTGGVLRQGFYSLSGYYGERVIENIQVDYAFMGIDAVNTEYGFMLTDHEEVGFKRKAAKNATKCIVLCDHEKFEQGALLNVWSASEVDMVITGKELSDELYQKYTDSGFMIHRV